MNEAPSGVVVLTARHATNYALVHAIAASVGIDHVVFEGFRTWRMIPYRLKKLGWRAVAGQLLFLAWDGIFVSSSSTSRGCETARRLRRESA